MKVREHGLPLMAAIVGCLVVALATPTTASAESDRLFAFGFNFASGYGAGTTVNPLPGDQVGPSHFDLELPGFEFRLFPVDEISVDFLWRIGNMAFLYQDSGLPFYLQNIYVHFHGDRHPVTKAGQASFAAGPGLIIGAMSKDGIQWGMLGIGGRFGVDFTDNSNFVDIGVYFRPGLFFSSSPQGTRPYLGSEIFVELSCTFQVAKPEASVE